MKADRHSEIDSDAVAVRRASRIVTWQVTVVASAIVIMVVVLSVAYILDQSQPKELLEPPGPGQNKIYVDTNKILVALIIFSVIAIVLASILSAVVARHAVRPLGEALRLQRRFVADASHELRTPLTVMDARIQVIQRSLPTGDNLEAAVAELRTDTRVLIDIVSDLLLAATPDNTRHSTVSLDVNEIVSETIRSLRVLADEQRITIELFSEPNINATIGALDLRRCLVALVENALAHSPMDSTIRVTVNSIKNTFEVVVTDHGSGIHGIDPKRIFDRFAHSDARLDTDPKTGGFGIGLSLVLDIVTRNGGNVELRETSPHGTVIAFSLPQRP